VYVSVRVVGGEWSQPRIFRDPACVRDKEREYVCVCVCVCVFARVWICLCIGGGGGHLLNSCHLVWERVSITLTTHTHLHTHKLFLPQRGR